MAKFTILFISLLIVSCAFAKDEEQKEEEAEEQEVTVESEEDKETFSLASARAQGKELTTVEMMVDAYMHLLDVVARDESAPAKYDEDSVLRQYAKYDNPYVPDIIRAFEKQKPTLEGPQAGSRLVQIVEDHFASHGFEPEEHKPIVERHELYDAVFTRFASPEQQVIREIVKAFTSPNAGHMGGEL